MTLAFVAALGAAPLPAASPAARDWTQVTARKPDGAFVQGNPNAPVKLVEFLSLTCPHCAKLEGEASAPLTAKYIRTGLVSYEVRHALRDAFDFSATVLARCGGERAFFQVLPPLYAAQDQWFARAATWSQTAPANLPPDKALTAAAHGAGLDQFFASHGLPPAKQEACLADASERKLLTTMAEQAWNRPGFPGTPAFLLNGAMLDGIASWADLDTKLAAVLKKKS